MAVKGKAGDKNTIYLFGGHYCRRIAWLKNAIRPTTELAML
jgi:hypothetical protein